MPTWLFQLQHSVVWSAVAAVAAGALGLIAALLGGSLEVVVGFGAAGLILAVLSQK
jgi:hypothetical protein